MRMRCFDVDYSDENRLILRLFNKDNGVFLEEIQNGYPLVREDIPGLIKVLQDFMVKQGEQEAEAEVSDNPLMVGVILDKFSSIEVRVATIERELRRGSCDDYTHTKPRIGQKPGAETTKGNS